MFLSVKIWTNAHISKIHLLLPCATPSYTLYICIMHNQWGSNGYTASQEELDCKTNHVTKWP